MGGPGSGRKSVISVQGLEKKTGPESEGLELKDGPSELDAQRERILRSNDLSEETLRSMERGGEEIGRARHQKTVEIAQEVVAKAVDKRPSDKRLDYEHTGSAVRPAFGFSVPQFVETLKVFLQKPLLRRFGPLVVEPMWGQQKDVDPNLREWGVRVPGCTRLLVLIHPNNFQVLDTNFLHALKEDPATRPFMRWCK